MRDGDGRLEMAREGDTLILRAGGHWRVDTAAKLDRALHGLDSLGAHQAVHFDLAQIESMDTVGAWLVLRTCRRLEAGGAAASIANLPPAFAPLFDQVAQREPPMPESEHRHALAEIVEAGLAYVGGAAIDFMVIARDLLGFFGLVSVTVWRTLRHPRRLRSVALVAQMQRAGVAALPIVGLLSFLIGIVIAYQGADQLRRFGAEIFTVNLLGIGVLRELGVLLTAIIVAGRSGSAYAAEIGAMQVNEEIDAMRTLGLDPVEVLVLPRLFGLVLALPLLVVYADFMGMVGGALMSWTALGIPLPLFVRQLQGAIGSWTFWVGIIKAPFFAATIALVGCQAGLRVSGSAESVGRLTTVAVVHSIFLVIIIDAFFSILFARLHV